MLVLDMAYSVQVVSTIMLSLKETRDLISASQKGLADAAGVESQVIARIEQGRAERPAYELVVRVVRGLQKLGLSGITAEQITEFHVPEPQPEHQQEARTA